MKHANDCRAIIECGWYRRLFPGMQVSRKNTELEVVTSLHGYRLATSIDGTLTGRGGDIIVIDDPLKPGDAQSESRREHVNEWYANTLVSRLDDKVAGAIVVVMQRLHVDDLTGALLRSGEEWTVLNVPAIAEVEQTVQIGPGVFHTRQVGDVLHPEREPRRVVDLIRSQVGSDNFAAQYQQSPLPPGGAMIKRDWVRRYDRPPARPDRRRDVCICVRSIQLEGAERGEQGGAYSRPLEGQVCEYWRRIMARHAGRSMTQPFPPLVARTVSLSSAKPGLIRNPTAAGLEAGHISMKCSTRRIRGWVSRHDLSIGQERRRARLCPDKPEGKAIEAQTPLRKKHVFGYEKGPIGFRRRPQVSRGQT